MCQIVVHGIKAQSETEMKGEQKKQRSWNGLGKSEYEMGEGEYDDMKGKDGMIRWPGVFKTKWKTEENYEKKRKKKQGKKIKVK